MEILKLLIMKVLFSQSKFLKLRISLGSYSARSFQSLSMENQISEPSMLFTPPLPPIPILPQRTLVILWHCSHALLEGRLCSKASLLDLRQKALALNSCIPLSLLSLGFHERYLHLPCLSLLYLQSWLNPN